MWRRLSALSYWPLYPCAIRRAMVRNCWIQIIKWWKFYTMLHTIPLSKPRKQHLFTQFPMTTLYMKRKQHRTLHGVSRVIYMLLITARRSLTVFLTRSITKRISG
ncbi:hypothetical protein DSY0019 [Desulfitobacterium hafniense Y51]|uniref:Uncharacterized protein n=1 Tax=Desulfitobacterium hafniense (strain Y51) TaxID=138119 RepID=Q252I4_DESHY|nr:hypothetical protein DSY0019 [Desulfitobacterium hafniense Y51]